MSNRCLVFVFLGILTFNVFAQDQNCESLNYSNSIKNYCVELEDEKLAIKKFEVFKFKNKEGYKIVPFDSAEYLGDKQFEIVYYGDPVVYKYKEDSLLALSSERVFFYLNDSSEVILIEVFQHEDPERAQYDSSYYYFRKDQLVMYKNIQVNHDYWSKKQTHTKKVVTDIFCDHQTIYSEEANTKLYKKPLDAMSVKSFN